MRGPKLTQAIGILTLALAVPGPRGEAAAVNPAFASVAAERVAVSGASEQDPEAYQYLRADAKGRLFLLHGDTLAVDQLQPSGKLVAAVKPPVRRETDDGGVIIDAALSPDGESWLLLQRSRQLALLKGDELHALPAAIWMVSALAFTLDGPVVAVLPSQEMVGEDATAPRAIATFEKPPLLLRLHEQKWQMLVPSKVFERRDSRALIPQEIQAERASRLAAGPKGSLWVAQQDAYALKRYSRSGVLESSVLVGGGRVQWKDRTEDDWKRLEKSAQAGGLKLNRSQLAKVEAVRVVRTLAAEAGRVYLVVETPSGLALDRWDAETQELTRVQLANITTPPPRLSMAAGRDGLYFAGPHLGEPVWRLDWQQVEGAKWKPVPESVIEGSTTMPKAP